MTQPVPSGTPGNDVAQTKPQRELTPRERVAKFTPSFSKVLPRSLGFDADTFAALLSMMLQRDPKLREAATLSPDSLIHAAIHCASLGHLPGEGYAFTVRKIKGVPTVVGIEEYTGMLDRMYRAGAVSTIKCEVVRKTDHFDWRPTEMRVPEHWVTAPGGALARTADRGDIIGVYAYAEMVTGSVSQVVVFNRDQIDARRPKHASDQFWGTWEEEQTLKTALRRLQKYVPTSRDYRADMAQVQIQRAEALATLPAAAPLDYTHDNPELDLGDVVDADSEWADAVDVTEE